MSPRSKKPAIDFGRSGRPGRRNALKHGITSTAPFIPGLEEESDWIAFRDGIIASFDPEGTLEATLAYRVATLLWRIDRVTRLEVATINDQGEQVPMDVAAADAYRDGTLARGEEVPEPHPERVLYAQETRVIPAGTALDKILRYETHVHRLWIQTLHELEALQARRRGQPVHLARLDISSPPP